MKLLEVTGLVKRFGGLTATDGVDLTVHAGEIHAVIGPNGAGKTTLINQLSGEMRSDAGSIRFEDRDVTLEPVHRRAVEPLAEREHARDGHEVRGVLHPPPREWRESDTARAPTR